MMHHICRQCIENDNSSVQIKRRVKKYDMQKCLNEIEYEVTPFNIYKEQIYNLLEFLLENGFNHVRI